MPEQPRILIAGTGRAGTSFLVRLLTRLGYDTGYSSHKDDFNPITRAGCEIITHGQRMDPEAWLRMPRIVKSPYLSLCIERIPVPIAHVFCPVRNLDEVAASREDCRLRWEVPPAEALGRLVAGCVQREIPLTLMRFPDSVTDPVYCRRMLARGIDGIHEQPGFYRVFKELQP